MKKKKYLVKSQRHLPSQNIAIIDKEDGKEDGNNMSDRSYSDRLVETVAQLYRREEYTDLTISSNGIEWKVHKLVVCSQSDNLKTTLSWGSQMKKIEKNEIDLDDDPKVIEAMLRFFYTADYGSSDTSSDDSNDDVAPMVLDVRVFVAADKYVVPLLLALAEKRFAERCKKIWATPQFADAVREVYTTVPEHRESLKKHIVSTIQNHREEIFSKANSEKLARLRNVFRDIADFGADCVENFATNIDMEERLLTYRCPNCGETFGIGVPGPQSFGCSRNCYSSYGQDWWASYRVNK